MLRVYLVNAFTSNGNGGNPAGVVLDGDKLSSQQKLVIAQRIGFSETAFIDSIDGNVITTSFFTPTGPIAYCGHATLASFYTLNHLGILHDGEYDQITSVGEHLVSIEDGYIEMSQALPVFGDTFTAESIAPLFSLKSADILNTHLPVCTVSTGLADLMLPVASGVLDSLTPNFDAISQFSSEHGLIGVHVFEVCDSSSLISARCRNFAPLFGITEESATGSACGALACYLSKFRPDLTSSYVFEQGAVLGQASLISAKVMSNEIDGTKRILVGGNATPQGDVYIEV